MKLALMLIPVCAMALLAWGDDRPPAGSNGPAPSAVATNERPSIEAARKASPLANGTRRVQDVLGGAAAAVVQRVDTNRLESWHDGWSHKLVATVERFDRFFGDARLEDDNRGTWVRVGLGLTASVEGGTWMESKVQTRLALPGLRERLHVIVDDIVESDSPEDVDALAEAARESRPDAALRWIFRQTRSIRINADAGIRVGGETKVFGKLRWRRITPFERWELRLSEVADWYSSDGFGATSEMRWSRPFPRGWLFQSVSVVRWQEQSDGVTPSQSLGLYQAVLPALARRVVADGVWPEAPHVEAATYRVYYSLRRRIYSDWLFAELRPGVAFAQVNDYRADPFVTVLFEMVFGEP